MRSVKVRKTECYRINAKKLLCKNVAICKKIYVYAKRVRDTRINILNAIHDRMKHLRMFSRGNKIFFIYPRILELKAEIGLTMTYRSISVSSARAPRLVGRKS